MIRGINGLWHSLISLRNGENGVLMWYSGVEVSFRGNPSSAYYSRAIGPSNIFLLVFRSSSEICPSVRLFQLKTDEVSVLRGHHFAQLACFLLAKRAPNYLCSGLATTCQSFNLRF